MSAPEPPPRPPGDGELMREAAFWFARMRGPEAEASRAGFEAWLARGALHRAAYNRAAEVFAFGKLLAEDRAEPTTQAAAPDRPAADRPPAGPPRSTARLATALAALLVAVAIAALWLAGRGTAPGAGDAGIAEAGQAAAGTGRVEIAADAPRAFDLADGSRVELGAHSRLLVRIDGATRRIDLMRGRARFAVRHDGRPFTVHAGGGTVTARGTLFAVALSAGRRVEVRLIEGAVDVALPARAGASEIRRLRPGESVAYAARRDPDAATGGAAAPDDAPETAVEELDAVPLGQLIARANRGASRPVRLADPALAGLRVSGRLRIDDTQRLAAQLARLLDLAVEAGPDGEIVLRRPD